MAGEMTPKEILTALHANTGKRVRVTYEDGTIQSVDIHSVDEDGFLHSGLDGDKPAHFWSRFEEVRLVEAVY